MRTRLALLACLAALPARLAAQPAAPIVLVVNADGDALSWQGLHERLSPVLGAPIVSREQAVTGDTRGTLTVTWRPSRRELAVTFQEVARGTVSRVVPAPATAEETLTTATELAVNLVRDDAAELLGRPAPAVAPPPASPPPPPPAPAPVVVVHAAPPPPAPTIPVAASLFYPLATNASTPEARVRLSLNFLHGRVGEIDGAQLGFGVNETSGPVRGGQLAMGVNLAGGPVRGFQSAFGLNWAGAVRGFQVAFGLNRAVAEVHGFQAAMGVNSAGGEVRGAQAALGVNLAGDVRGLQLGFVNVAGRVKGVQLGLINVADDVEGIPIGLISVTRSGGVHPVFWGSTESHLNVGLKFSTRYTYTLFSGSGHRQGTPTPLIGQPTEDSFGEWAFGPGLAIGARIPFAPLYFETDVGATYLFGGKFCCVTAEEGLPDDRVLTRLRMLLGASLHQRFSVFAGGALTLRTTFDDEAEPVNHVRPELFAGIQL